MARLRRMGVTMRRTVLIFLLAAFAAAVLPLTAGAAGSGHEAGSAATQTTPTAKAVAFTLGAQPCSLIPVPAAGGTTPVATGACPGVRPGALVQTEVGLCTDNFLFQGANGDRFIGTAGHCILGKGPKPGDAGEKVWPKGTGPEAKDEKGKRIGEFAYAILQDPKDFSLIRLDPGVQASPEMCNFGGPTGINDDITPDTVTLEYFGNGVGAGSTIPARSAVALGLSNPDHVYALGLALPGDSGSGVISQDGRAVGVLVTTGIHGLGISQNGVDFGTMGITRIHPQMIQASTMIGTPLDLVTAHK
jgi:hypothetical protein